MTHHNVACTERDGYGTSWSTLYNTSMPEIGTRIIILQTEAKLPHFHYLSVMMKLWHDRMTACSDPGFLTKEQTLLEKPSN